VGHRATLFACFFSPALILSSPEGADELAQRKSESTTQNKLQFSDTLYTKSLENASGAWEPKKWRAVQTKEWPM
jgi:hypothetical protein